MDTNIYISKLETSLALKNLTTNTAKSYTSYLKCFLHFLGDETPETASYDRLRDFIFFLKDDKKLSNRSINAYIALLKFFYQYCLNLPWNSYQIPTMKFDSYLPTVLSIDDVDSFIDSFSNLKHKAIVAIMYSSGLRVSEVCQLKYTDINRKSMSVHVRKSKSRTDRYAVLSSRCLKILTEYWYTFGKPSDWLFPGQKYKGSCIVNNTAARIISNQVKHLGWSKKVTCHTFRHSFGTHLYEQGNDLVAIQQLLGHKCIGSTMIYIHLSSKAKLGLVSPFDRRDV